MHSSEWCHGSQWLVRNYEVLIVQYFQFHSEWTSEWFPPQGRERWSGEGWMETNFSYSVTSLFHSGDSGWNPLLQLLKLEVLLKYKFWLRRSGMGPEILHFWPAPWVMPMTLEHKPHFWLAGEERAVRQMGEKVLTNLWEQNPRSEKMDLCVSGKSGWEGEEVLWGPVEKQPESGG